MIQIIVKFRAEKNCVRFYRPTSFWRGWNINYENNYASVTIWFIISLLQLQLFLKKGARFFTAVHACTKNLNKACTKFSQSFKLPICGLVVFINMNTKCINLQKKAGVSKHYWKKIMQLLWTVSTYLLKNVNHGIENDIDSNYGDIGLFWHLQQIWRIPYLAI